MTSNRPIRLGIEFDITVSRVVRRFVRCRHYPFSSVDPSELLPVRSRSNTIASNFTAAAACPWLSMTTVTQLLVGAT
jgi:hypothetical protein